MELKETFNANARLYNEMRPKYDKSILDNIKKYVDLDDTTEVLEIGCGTGQATELFIDTKARIHSIDIGRELIDICNLKYSKYRNVEFEVFQYEEYPEKLKFDLVFSATAYHWVKQPVGDKKHMKS
jgi:trans-aconitate methyltransferase